MLRCIAAALIGILGLSLTAMESSAATPGCTLAQIAELPVTMQDMKPVVAVTINGQDGRFLTDSGAFFSMLSPASAAAFHLKVRPAPFHLMVTGIGGQAEAEVTTVDHLTVAGINFPKKWDFAVGGSELRGVDGILGQNILRMADVEYDLANGVVRLMKPQGNCRSTNLVYWGKNDQAYSEMDIDSATPQHPHTEGVAFLNGKKIHVMFDTGSALSALTRRAAEIAGVAPNSPGTVRAGFNYGVGQHYEQAWIAPFQTFKIGQEEIRNMRLRFIDSTLSGPDVDMLIGADFFLSHRIYVATSQRKLFFTYNGGPVFNLTASPNTKTAGDSKSNPPATADAAPPTGGATSDTTGAAPPTIPGSEGEPTTAEALARRGTAFAARRDFEHAIADLSRACELAPQESRYFFERAQAYQNNKQPALANADIDEVLTLKPDDVPALMWRARRFLNGHNRQSAIADLDTVDHLEPPQADLRLDLGVLYAGANELPQAISQYNLWIKAHDSDVRLANAYNARCWAQAWLGTALDQGMSDCNKAIRVTADNPVTLESRALVRLRMDDFDHAIADYSAALKLQPRSAVALYGRGLAETHKQKTAAAGEDIAAATALAPHIAEEFKKRGVTQ
jgi:tetratricopeptide (TPR) repeat protein